MVSPSDLKDYNTEFAGVTEYGLGRDRLRFLKRELRDNPGVNKRYIQAGVREFVRPMQKIIDRIPNGSTLLVMPSTSRVNRIPIMLAKEIKRVRPDIEVVNGKERIVQTGHRSESKIKNRVIDRLDDQRTFRFTPKVDQLRELKRPLLILDDSISTGDSAIILHRELLKQGVHAQGIVTALAGSKYHTRLSDVERLYGKVKDSRPQGYSKDELKRDMLDTFVGYPDTKIKRVELGLTRSGTQLHNRPDLIVHFVRANATYLRNQRLDPSHMLEAKQQAQKIDQPFRLRVRRGPSL